MNKLSTERAIEALYTVRAYYASLTAGYPKGKDCKGIDDVTCSEIANSCLMAIKALEQPPCEDAISRQAVKDILDARGVKAIMTFEHFKELLDKLPSVAPQPKTGYWIETAEEYYKAINEKGGGVDEDTPYFTDDIACSECLAKFSVIDNETEHFIYCPNCGAKMEVGKNE